MDEMKKWFWRIVGNVGLDLMAAAQNHGWLQDKWDEALEVAEDEEWERQQADQGLYEQAKSEGYAEAMDDVRHQGM